MGQSQEIMPTEHFDHQASDTASRDEESGSDEGVYEVERIVGHCVQGDRIQYNIKWKGYSSAENTWEDEVNMACPELLDEYWSRQQQDLRKLPRSVLKPKKSPRSPWLSDPMTEPTEVRPDEGFEVREIVSTSSDEDEITVAAARKLKSPAKKRQTRHHTPLKPTAVSPAQNGSTARKKSTRYVTSSESSSEEELVDELPDLHDDLVERVITVQIINVTNDGIPRHYVIIELVNGKRTQCQLETAREHFPKKLVDFFVANLQYKKSPSKSPNKPSPDSVVKKPAARKPAKKRVKS